MEHRATKRRRGVVPNISLNAVADTKRKKKRHGGVFRCVDAYGLASLRKQLGTKRGSDSREIDAALGKSLDAIDTIRRRVFAGGTYRESSIALLGAAAW